MTMTKFKTFILALALSALPLQAGAWGNTFGTHQYGVPQYDGSIPGPILMPVRPYDPYAIQRQVRQDIQRSIAERERRLYQQEMLYLQRQRNSFLNSERSWKNTQSILGCCYGRVGERSGWE